MSDVKKMYRIIINGSVVRECPAYSTPLEVQHDLSVETGSPEGRRKFVRVEQFNVGGARGPRLKDEKEDE